MLHTTDENLPRPGAKREGEIGALSVDDSGITV